MSNAPIATLRLKSLLFSSTAKSLSINHHNIYDSQNQTTVKVEKDFEICSEIIENYC